MSRKLAFMGIAGIGGAVFSLTLGFAFAGWDPAGMANVWPLSQSFCPQAKGEAGDVVFPLTPAAGFAIHMQAAVQYMPGDKAEARVSGDKALLERVRMDDGQMSLDCFQGRFPARLEVHVSGPAITSWEVQDSAELALGQINQDQLTLSLSGGGRVEAQGAVDRLDLSVAGSGDARLPDLAVSSAVLRIEGSGDAAVTATKAVDATIKGSGSVIAKGSADRVDLAMSGSGKAQFAELVARAVQVRVEGSGDAHLTATGDADVSISGSGTVRLSGHPVMRRSEVNGSGELLLDP